MAEQQAQWSWFSVVYSLSKGDITKSEEVVNKPFLECLIWMTYEKMNNNNDL